MSLRSKQPFHGKVLFFSPSDRQLARDHKTTTIMSGTCLALGPASIATYLRLHGGMEAYVYCSTDYSPEAIARVIKTEKPAAIGVSCLTYNRFSCLTLAKIAKRIDPHIILIFGGTHATFLDWQILSNYPEVDYIVRGEGEITFLELLTALKDNTDITNVNGLSFRRDGKVVQTAPRPWSKTLDDFPLIDYKAVSLGTFESAEELNAANTLPVETSRGCPFPCTFCSQPGFMGNGVARRSVDKVIEQIDRILELGYKGMFFNDLNFTMDRPYTITLCETLVKRKVDLSWVCTTRINMIDKDLLLLLRGSGCRRIFYGVDSLCKKVLYSTGRKYEPSLAIDNLNLSISLGIHTNMNIIVGLPGETEENRWETLKNLTKVHKDVHVGPTGLRIYPGAEIYKIALREGFDESYWLSDHEEPFPLYTGSLSNEEMSAWINRYNSLLDLKIKQPLLKSMDNPREKLIHQGLAMKIYP